MSLKTVTALLGLAVVAPSLSAQAADDSFEAFQKQYRGQVNQYQQSVHDQFEAYRKQLMEAFADYRRKAAAVWGEKDARLPSKEQMVEYTDHMRERRTVDFERGQVQVELALTPQEASDPKKVKKRLQALVAETVTAPADTRPLPQIAKAPDAAKRSGKPVLEGLVRDREGRAVDSRNARRFASEVLAQGMKSRVQKGADGQSRVVVQASFPLIPDHIKKRAIEYRKVVDREAKRRHLDAKLVFAVMETESFFNPTARSPVPAFGLMQLVPTSGARDAYRHVYGRDRVVTDTYLYKPRNNVELGAAYLGLLYHQYLSGIDNPKTRLWCTIAAYNTGAGNVFSTFAGRRSHYSNVDAWKAAALAKLNRMSPAQVYTRLVRRLPYEETRQYVVKVRKRMPKYSGF